MMENVAKNTLLIDLYYDESPQNFETKPLSFVS